MLVEKLPDEIVVRAETALNHHPTTVVTTELHVEVLTTENAISTYNYLVEEGRVVAAALIPPSFVRIVDRDIIDTKERRKQLYGDGNINFLGSNKDSHPITTEEIIRKVKDK